MSETEAATSTSSSETTVEMQDTIEKRDDFLEPDTKKRKISQSVNTDRIKYKLEERLGGILCCAVCLDLPRAAVYQVSERNFCSYNKEILWILQFEAVT